jgi:uncharacterized membrane-anchored protein YjiN (DUF445 family)
MSESAPPTSRTASEQSLARRLRRMRALATGLLAAMAALFAVSTYWWPRYAWLGAVRAFAEAALVGGLADWFAVAALFRRPLGLPIPHTAIVPSRKDEIGRALARFIRDHFLVRDAIERQLQRTDLAARLGHWLDDEEAAARVSRDFATALAWLLRASDGEALRSSFAASLRTAPVELPIDAIVATLIDVLTASGHEQILVDQLVELGRAELDRHRVEIRVRIHERSPWWLPQFVDQEIYDQLVRELERILDDVTNDREHPARNEFKKRLVSLQQSLAGDPAFAAKAREMTATLLDHPAVRDYGRALWTRAQGWLHDALTDPSSALRKGLESEVQRIGRALKSDPTTASTLDAWLKQALLYLVDNYRDPLSEIVSETIERWDPAETASRVELNIGSDLQFIRLNGTLVGGCVGLLLYFGAELFV